MPVKTVPQWSLVCLLPRNGSLRRTAPTPATFILPPHRTYALIQVCQKKVIACITLPFHIECRPPWSHGCTEWNQYNHESLVFLQRKWEKANEGQSRRMRQCKPKPIIQDNSWQQICFICTHASVCINIFRQFNFWIKTKPAYHYCRTPSHNCSQNLILHDTTIGPHCDKFFGAVSYECTWQNRCGNWDWHLWLHRGQEYTVASRSFRHHHLQRR